MEHLTAISSHRMRALAFAAAGLVLVWLVAAKSLSYVVAETSPEFALWLNPNQPLALLTLAERARGRLLKLVTVEDDVTASVNASPQALNPRGEPAAGMSGAFADKLSLARERDQLRDEIGDLARRVISTEPLEARAFRLLAEAERDPAKLRPIMQEAMRRSRRESFAAFWLMNDSRERKDLADVIEKADIILRTRPELSAYALSFLTETADTPDSRARLVALLAKNPPWRSRFFDALPKHVRQSSAPLDLLIALKETGNPPSVKELAPYLNALVKSKRTDLAYSAWLQFVPAQKLASIGLLNNAGFSESPSGLPFDWSFQRGQNTVVDFVPTQGDGGGRALRLGFGVGRVKFPEMSQMLLLAPGRYRLTGEFQGLLTAERGLRWEFRCFDMKAPLAQTDMIRGSVRDWRAFQLEVDVPGTEACQAQFLRLYHHARSQSEELISGELSFREIKLVRVDR